MVYVRGSVKREKISLTEDHFIDLENEDFKNLRAIQAGPPVPEYSPGHHFLAFILTGIVRIYLYRLPRLLILLPYHHSWRLRSVVQPRSDNCRPLDAAREPPPVALPVPQHQHVSWGQ